VKANVSPEAVNPESEASKPEIDDAVDKEVEKLLAEFDATLVMEPVSEQEIEELLAEADAMLNDKPGKTAATSDAVQPEPEALEPGLLDQVSAEVNRRAPAVAKAVNASVLQQYDKLKKADKALTGAMGVENSLLGEYSDSDTMVNMLKARALKNASKAEQTMVNVGDMAVAAAKGGSASVIKGVFDLGEKVGASVKSALPDMVRENAAAPVSSAVITAAMHLHYVKQAAQVAAIPYDLAWVAGTACVDGVLASINAEVAGRAPALNPEPLQAAGSDVYGEWFAEKAGNIIQEVQESYAMEYEKLKKFDQALLDPEKGMSELLYNSPALGNKPEKAAALAARQQGLSQVGEVMSGVNAVSAGVTAVKGVISKNLYTAVKGATQYVCDGIKEQCIGENKALAAGRKTQTGYGR
jgi:hypothetical protein